MPAGERERAERSDRTARSTDAALRELGQHPFALERVTNATSAPSAPAVAARRLCGCPRLELRQAPSSIPTRTSVVGPGRAWPGTAVAESGDVARAAPCGPPRERIGPERAGCDVLGRIDLEAERFASKAMPCRYRRRRFRCGLCCFIGIGFLDH